MESMQITTMWITFGNLLLKIPILTLEVKSIKTGLIQIVAMDAKLNPYVDKRDDSKVDTRGNRNKKKKK